MDLEQYFSRLRAVAAAHGLMPDPGPLADLNLPLVLSGQFRGQRVRLVPLPPPPGPEALAALVEAVAVRLARAAGRDGGPGEEAGRWGAGDGDATAAGEQAGDRTGNGEAAPGLAAEDGAAGPADPAEPANTDGNGDPVASGGAADGETAPEEDEAVVLACLFPSGAGPDMAALRGLGRSGPGWRLVVWAVDLDLELVDRPPGSPALPEPVLRALCTWPDRAEPRGPDPFFRSNRGFLGLLRQWARGEFGPVPVTRFLLAANVAVYLWTLLQDPLSLPWGLLSGPSPEVLLRWGANSTERVLGSGEQWRLLTAAFLHTGLWHLGLNMYALWGLGQHAELLFGSGPLAFIYFVAAVGGSVASVGLRAWVLSVGASGAIFGLLGALLYAQRALGRRVDWRDLAGPLGASLLWGLFLNIDNLGHIGGLIAGALAAWAVGTPGQRRPWRRGVTWGIGLLVLLLVTGVLPVPWVPLF